MPKKSVVFVLALAAFGACSSSDAQDRHQQSDHEPALPPLALTRLGTSRWYFSKPVTNLAYSADGKRLIGCVGDLLVLDASTGKEIRTLPVSAMMSTLVLASDGKAAVTAGEGIVIWDTTTGIRVRSFQAHVSGTTILCGSTDGKILAGIGNDAIYNQKFGFGPRPEISARVWDATTGEQLKPFRAGLKNPLSLTVSPDGKSLAWGTADGSVRVLNVSDGKERFQFKVSMSTRPRAEPRLPLAFSPDNRLLAFGTQDGLVLVDAVSGKSKKNFSRKKVAEVGDELLNVAFSSKGDVAGEWNLSGLTSWDVGTGQEMPRLKVSLHAALSPDGKTAAMANGHMIELVDVATGERRTDAGLVRAGRFALSPDAKVVATVETKKVRFWDRATGKVLRTLDIETTPNRFVFSPDGATLITLCNYNRPILFDVLTGKKRKEFPPIDVQDHGIAFAPDGSAVAAPTTTGDGKIALWNLTIGTLSVLAGNRKASVLSVAFTPDGKHLLAGTGDIQEPINIKEGRWKFSQDGAVYVWDLATHKELRRIKTSERYVWDLSVSPDSKRVVGKFGWISLADPEQRGELGQAKTLAYSPDGKTLAVSFEVIHLIDTHAPIHVIDVKSNKLLTTLEGHVNQVHGLAFSPDGQILVSGGAGTIFVWDLSKLKR